MAYEPSTEAISVQTSSVKGGIYSSEYNAVEFDPITPIQMVSCLISFLGLLLNSIIVYLVKKHRELHTPSMYLRLAYVLLDFIFAFIILLQIISVRLDAGDDMYCTLSTLLAGLYLMTIQVTAYIAVERYYYFCKPMIYLRVFNVRFIAVAIILIFTCCFIFKMLTDFIIGSDKHPDVTMCQLSDQRLNTAFQILIFFVPAIICIILSIIEIKKLMKSLENTPDFMPPASGSNVESLEPRVRRKEGERSLR